MRVLVLHQHYWPETAATAQILADVCEDLVTYGHEVLVICGQPSYRAEDSNILPEQEYHNGVHIRRVPTYVPSTRTIARRLAQYFGFFGHSLSRSLIENRPDVCLVMSTPPLLLGLSGALLRMLRGVPFAYSVQDLYPDIAVHLGVLRQTGLLTKVITAASSSIYRRADTIITLSPQMAERLIHKGVQPHRVDVIPNWADTTAIRPDERNNPFAIGHALNEGFVVLYSGNLGLSQGLEHVVEAADLLRDQSVVFAFVGDGNAKQMLMQRANELTLSNVIFLPPQPRAQLSLLLASCDVGLVTMKLGVGSDLVPSKLYGLLAAGRPIVAAVEAGSEVAKVVGTHECGWIAGAENATSLAQTIEAAMLTAAAHREAMGRRGREASVTLYSRSALTRQYELALQRLANSGRARSRFSSPT